jgi:DNA modification methylase
MTEDGGGQQASLTCETPATRAIDSVEAFRVQLQRLTSLDGELSSPLARSVQAALDELGPARLDERVATSRFYGLMNQKLMSSKAVLSEIYSFAASHGVTFNYPSKLSMAWAVDSSDVDLFDRIVLQLGSSSPSLAAGLRERFRPLTHDETRHLIIAETRNPTKLRKALARTVVNDVFASCAGPLTWSLWPEEHLHRHFFDGRSGAYSGDYMQDLRTDQPGLFDRRRALVVARVPAGASTADVCGLVEAEYAAINNYGFLALLFETGDASHAWRTISDVTLFAERFDEYPLDKQFFRAKKVAEETAAYIPTLELSAAKFDSVNEGFAYRDTFVLGNSDASRVERALVVLQKNKRDETPVPCPACRSLRVRGNSYPSLGVKSWECQNPLCPDRSIYNRGKRYSFKALLAQAAIEHVENEIPVESVRTWQRDVLEDPGDERVLDMLLRHYSMAGDGVALVGSMTEPQQPLRRVIVHETWRATPPSHDFWADSGFVHRYIPGPRSPVRLERALPEENHAVVLGDAADVLAEFPEAVFDGAVTSPPYYNAREYAQWPNLYAYAHDMWRIAAEVFRTLKPGAVYAYNIFDYFDNERIVAYSAMGQKRIALSAVMADVFVKVGFEMAGVAVWDKGEIHGKRGFNAGNFSPFYQSPFNCWEHVMLLRKPSPAVQADPPIANAWLRIHPVVKMVRGENVFGHTAPFPVELAERCIEDLAPGGLVLDPFGGSGTTSRAASNLGLRSVLIERDPEYAELSRRMISDHVRDAENRALRLF